ncbi:MAG: cyclopropane fatty acyl phospholipid synthase [Candidatus Buchananbacteria bacterium]|nr:cyclopropane fatty acyl phospholipid synthase [Candidatus Buchananbacteria bacterium]
MSNNLQQRAVELLRHADLEVNGSDPWDPQVHDNRMFSRVFRQGSLGLGESYMDGWWDAAQLDEFFHRLLKADLASAIKPIALLPLVARDVVLNPQAGRRSFKVGEQHYDTGNDLYRAMLDKRLTYTCGYWKDATTLDEAQEAKLDLICRKLGLKAGDRVLDIGCGWGSFMKFAAEKYGVSCVGVTVSKEQVALGQELCQGLPVEFRLTDYRAVNEKFDHIVSVGMFEHVGTKNYKTYFEVARRCLKPEGLFLLHTIGSNRSRRTSDRWLDKYIFPNSILPSIAQIGKASEKHFIIEDLHNFSAYYDKTLMAWHANFEAAWPDLKSQYDERFYRMWRYYLLSCAGLFRARQAQLWQIVLSPHGVKGGYTSIR